MFSLGICNKHELSIVPVNLWFQNLWKTDNTSKHRIIFNWNTKFKTIFFFFSAVYLIGLEYKTIYIDGVLTGANELIIGQGVNFLIGEKVCFKIH